MTRPNIILIVADDHGYADMGCLGVDPEVQTPNLDRLAAAGVRCTNAYVSAPVCNPSRAGILTGQYQQRWGGWYFGSPAFPESVPTIAEKLKTLGYSTCYLGKVHYAGRDRPDMRTFPLRHGFDTAFVALTGGRVHYLRHSRSAVMEYGAAAQQMCVDPLWEDDRQVDFEGFTTDEFGRRARAFVEKSADRPFFLQLAFNAVHNFTWQLPEEYLRERGLPKYRDWDPAEHPYLEWYDGAIVPNLPHGREYYRAQLFYMDRQIGLLLDTLDRLNLAQNTIVAYLTDNGGSNCNYGRNTPLRGTKYTLYEGGVRVPLIFRWPGRLPAGTVRHGMVSALDLCPTLLAAAGAAPGSGGPSDGLNIMPLLEGQPDPGHATLVWDCQWQWSIRHENWKLKCVVNDKYADDVRRIEHSDPGRGLELFDLESDPSETCDLAASRPDKIRELTERHRAWRTMIGASVSET